MASLETLSAEILKKTRAIHPRQIEWRRHLHRYPELAFEEHKTTAFLKKELKKLGLKILPLKMKTGVLAELTGTGKSPIIAVRSDIDALPIIEQTGLPFKSQHEGCMHACGHDMHMATVLGVAAVLAGMKEHVNGKVRFIFQPAEEQPPGGAQPMIKEGALKDVKMILGLHVDPDIPTGKISLRDGDTMGAVYDFDLTVIGKGGHAARPHSTVDAIVVAAEIIDSLQKVISREIDPVQPAVITFGKIEGGRVRNAVADRVILNGTARTLDAQSYRKVPKLIERTVKGICRARGAKYVLDPISNFPVLKNNPAVNRRLAKTYETLYGKGGISVTEQVLGGEDFAFYLQKVPGAMFRLGVKNNKIKANQPWHSPEFIADEAALKVGTALLAGTLLDFLADN